MKPGGLISLIALGCATFTGCGSATRSARQRPGAAGPALPPAAEPAVARGAHARAVGRVVPVSGAPEGVVVDDRDGVIAAAVRRPPGLVLVDEQTGRLKRRLALPGAARHLRLAGPEGPLLVPAETADSLAEVNLPTGIVTSVTRAARQPHDAVVLPDGRVVTSGEFGRSVSIVHGIRVVASIPGFVQPAGVAVAAGKLAVVDVRRNDITLFDARTLRKLGSAGAGRGPTHVVATRGGHFAVVDTRGGALLLFAASPRPTLRDRIPLAGTPYGLAADPRRGRVWVTLTAEDRVASIQLGRGHARVLATAPTVHEPNSVAVGESSGRVVVAGATDPGAIQILSGSNR
jgi:DNA-binding beta-propeller fold protein YncE